VKLEIKVFLPLFTLLNHAVADRAVRFLDPESDEVVFLWGSDEIFHD
jgi:hypothetical protein